jgi:cell division protein FtsZ
MPQVAPAIETFARIKVVGVGGAGGAAVNRMIESGVGNVDFIVVNTDAQALHHSHAPIKIHIGRDATRGLGAGADPLVGQEAAEESADEIREALEGADMVFITIGAGGGTGSGAGHVVARLARERGALVVGFATKPFAFEGERRRQNGEWAIDRLREQVDTLIVIPNDRLLQTIDRHTPLLEAFKVADDVLRQGVQGISDLITVHGLINLDFADVRAVMSNAGSALMGIGRASGDERAVDAAQQAIESPLLEVSIDGARGILFNVIGGMDMSMHEINAAAEAITAAADPSANIIFGATINPDLEGEMIITVIATGFDASYFTSRTQTNAADAHAAATQEAASRAAAASEPVEQPVLVQPPVQAAPVTTNDRDTDLSGLDMDLDKEEPESFIKETESKTQPSIWSAAEAEDDEDDEPDYAPPRPALSDKEDEIDKPSFLRRLRKKQDDSEG